MGFKSCYEYIKSDLYRYHGKLSLSLLFKEYWLNRGFCFMFWFRIAQSNIYLLSPLASFWVNTKRVRYGIDISPKMKVGYGLYIGHSGPVVINSTCQIGNNCNLSQFVSIGSNDGNAAIIGDNTYIGPNSCLVGNVIIGTNVTIGAGSVVTKDLPDNCTAVGNYARPISFVNSGQFIKNVYENITGNR